MKNPYLKCVLIENGEIEGVFIFEDYPYCLQNKYEFICKSNCEDWLKNYFEITNETFHTLWLAKWYIISSKKDDVNLLQSVLSSIFISNVEIESLLLALDHKNISNKNDESSEPFDILLNRLHKIHRNKITNNNDSSENDGIKIIEQDITPIGFIRDNNNRYIVNAIQFIQNNNENNNNEILSNIMQLELIDDDNECYLLASQLSILCQNKIDMNTLNITNQKPFVIDGQIVINNEFKTQDPNIYAIGEISKLSRKYTNNNKNNFKYTNSFDMVYNLLIK